MRKLLTLALLLTITGFVNAQDGFITAAQHYEELETVLKDAHGDNVFLAMAMSIEMPIAGVTLEVDVLQGKAQWWMYVFFAPDEALMVTGMAIDHPMLGRMIVEVGTEEIPPDYDSSIVMPGWADSDAAAAAMRGFGLQGYFDARASAKGLAMVLGPPEMTAHSIWVAMASDGIDSLQCIIDAVTLEQIQCGVLSDVEELQTARDFQLTAPYPNPVRSGIVPTIGVSVTQASHIRVSIYDVMGRCLGVLADQHFEPGTTSLIVPSSLLPRSGTVFVTAESDRGVSTRKLTIIR